MNYCLGKIFYFFKRSTFVSSAWSFCFFIPATTANDLRLWRISIPDLINYIIVSYLNYISNFIYFTTITKSEYRIHITCSFFIILMKRKLNVEYLKLVKKTICKLLCSHGIALKNSMYITFIWQRSEQFSLPDFLKFLHVVNWSCLTSLSDLKTPFCSYQSDKLYSDGQTDRFFKRGIIHTVVFYLFKTRW